MLASILTRIAASAVPWHLFGLAAAGLALTTAVAFHIVTVTRLEAAVARAQVAQAEALADIARRDAQIGELERAIATQNTVVARMQADGQVRARRADVAAKRELSRPPTPVPQDVAALNVWIRQPTGDAR
ncbi:hypothetical protein CHU95_19950 [Niveispirillum lacus]|uniref:Uncharacterized protein n=1 Tax=Niveispirillum lacus TaxID=1981099 RepID=A0A255YQD2_9PROT|nr:hypothetical protein [Niveispirillum lacus]OYQ31427.1 hypothetical protein CHU95_19950 [Niveispirillum lacus]